MQMRQIRGTVNDPKLDLNFSCAEVKHTSFIQSLNDSTDVVISHPIADAHNSVNLVD